MWNLQDQNPSETVPSFLPFSSGCRFSILPLPPLLGNQKIELLFLRVFNPTDHIKCYKFRRGKKKLHIL